MRKLRLSIMLIFSICSFVMQAQNFGAEIISNQKFNDGLMVVRAKVVPISGTVSNIFFYNRVDEPWNDNRWYEYDWELRGQYPDRGWSQIRVREEAGGELKDAPVDVRANVNLGNQMYNYILIRKGNMYVYDIREFFDINSYDPNNGAAHGGNSVSILTAGPRIYYTGNGVGDIPTWVDLDFSLGITAFDNGWSGSLPEGSYAGDYTVDYARFYQYSGNNLNNYTSWSEEFNGNSLDYGKWSVANWDYYKTQFTTDNMKFENGNIIMRISDQRGFNTVTTPPAPTCDVTSAPANRTISNVTETAARLNWTNDSNVDFYDVRYKKTSDSNWQVVSSITAGNQAVNNLTQGTAYQWQVRGRCANGSSSSYASGPNFTTQQRVVVNDNCRLPWSDADYAVSSTTNNYRSGQVNISCASSVCITMDIEGVGPMENADYLNVYYKVNGGSEQAISLNNNSFSNKSISVCSISGSNVEIVINARTSQSAEIYNVRNIQIIEDNSQVTGNGNDQNPSDSGNSDDSGDSGDANDCYTLYDSENFESSFGIWNDGGSDCSRDRNIGNAAQGSDWHIRLRDDSGSASSMYTDDLAFNNVTEVKVDFMYYPLSVENGEDFMLEYSPNGGSSWELIQAWVAGSEFTNGQYYSESVTINKNFSNNTKLRFRCDASSNGDKVWIDNAEIFVCGSAGLNSNGNISANQIVGDDATLSLAAMEDEESKVEVRSIGDTFIKSEGSNEMVLYPNPVSDVLTIKNASLNGPIQIISISGQIVKTTYGQKVDVSDLENGIYLLRSGETIKRFIKQ